MDVYERVIHYDQHNVGRAARVLFIKIWPPFLPIVLPAACLILLIVAVVSISYPALRNVGIMCASLVTINLVWWPYMYLRFYRRLTAFWRGEGLLKIGPDGIYVRLDKGESHLAWPMVKETLQASNMLFLFLSRSRFLMIPTDNIPDSILQALKDLVLRHPFAPQP